MAVSAVQNENGLLAALGPSAAGQAGGIKSVEDRFLKLLVTQLKNQDPMNPMENAELTMQLAQMSTVEGINNLNTSLASLLDSYRNSQTLQAASLIDRQVLVDGDRLQLAGGLGGGAVELKQAADQVRVDILDAYGQAVRSLNLGQASAGLQRFAWDGLDSFGKPVADGVYRFAVNASRAGEPVEGIALSLDRVASVVTQGGQVRIGLLGVGERGLEQVRQIF
ncbi:MAG: flagellar hook assembly protein FlgD [Thiobacillaceae bacterium]|jgi:flagellar basal-body rod modification protein FlgD|nr:flagellar hook assembly protein FlgD [Thiobacillaceae bacterium]